uniref:DUF2442 domain-containing protein n=1 Tax=Candidatus Kentrum sp. MB TaxID=2138164 RepID=A0A450X241_9GAMM|nr:MAG: Protein of unknown function (DUF2442) [Candidatus Kentron sp. MB]VFK28430.1 MAG: Protein of unknown function (DUF2442) [Candidatus Kentron sp. MB]VFK74250.1 MAG: Protein of unknown function (DUF2442) [Candidatus Kentron sp. MB]
MIQVTAVEPGPDYGLLVTFSNGENRHFDMWPYLHYPVFRKLENPGFFALASVDYGTVTWPGEIDIAPETLFIEGAPTRSTEG